MVAPARIEAGGDQMIDLTVCPECDQPAEVLWRSVLFSTGGPIEHATVLCVGKHRFFLPVELLPALPAVPAPEVPMVPEVAPRPSVPVRRSIPTQDRGTTS
jgi:hypothetical protein